MAAPKHKSDVDLGRTTFTEGVTRGRRSTPLAPPRTFESLRSLTLRGSLRRRERTPQGFRLEGYLHRREIRTPNYSSSFNVRENKGDECRVTRLHTP